MITFLVFFCHKEYCEILILRSIQSLMCVIGPVAETQRRITSTGVLVYLAHVWVKAEAEKVKSNTFWPKLFLFSPWVCKHCNHTYTDTGFFYSVFVGNGSKRLFFLLLVL